MFMQTRFEELIEQHRLILRQFVITELDLAITFSQRMQTANHSVASDQALKPSQKETMHRNLDNAKKACHAAVHAMERTDENLAYDPEVAERLRKVQQTLEAA